MRRHTRIAMNMFALVMPRAIRREANEVAISVGRLPDPVTGNAANDDLQVMSRKICLRRLPWNRHVNDDS